MPPTAKKPMTIVIKVTGINLVDALIKSLRFMPIKVAEAVAKMAQKQGLAQAEETDMSKAVQDLKWYPEY